MEQRKELTTLQEQAPAGSQESDRITWSSRTTAVPLYKKKRKVHLPLIRSTIFHDDYTEKRDTACFTQCLFLLCLKCFNKRVYFPPL